MREQARTHLQELGKSLLRHLLTLGSEQHVHSLHCCRAQQCLKHKPADVACRAGEQHHAVPEGIPYGQVGRGGCCHGFGSDCELWLGRTPTLSWCGAGGAGYWEWGTAAVSGPAAQ